MENPQNGIAVHVDGESSGSVALTEGRVPALMIVSADARLVDAARKAAVPGMAIMTATDIDDALEQSVLVEPGVSIVDAAGSRDVSALLLQLTRQLPELVVIVAGDHDDANSLLRMAVEGRVFRFLLKPLSHGQTSLAIKAAITQHIELTASSARREAQTRASKSRNYIAGYGALAVIAALAIGGTWYAVDRNVLGRPPLAARDPEVVSVAADVEAERVDPVAAELALAQEAFAAGHYLEPRSASALELYRGVLAADPDNEAALRGIRQITEKIMERAEVALTAGRLEEATDNIELARDIEPSHPRLLFLDVQVERERERLQIAQQRDVEDRVRALLSQADEEMRNGRPSDAHRALLSARKIDPTNPGIANGMRELTVWFVGQARAALDAGKLKEAEALVDSARQLGSAGAALAAIERQLLQRAARAPAPEMPQPAPANVDESAIAKSPLPGTSASSREPMHTMSPDRGTDIAPSDEPIEAASIPRTREIAPKYPREAMIARLEGYVELEFTISPEGVPEDIVVRESKPRRTFDRAAMDAVRHWRFQPVMRDGAPAAQRARLRMTFTL